MKWHPREGSNTACSRQSPACAGFTPTVQEMVAVRALGGAPRAAEAVSSPMAQGTSVQPDTRIASAAKACPSPPLPADELSSHHKQLITRGIQLTNAKSQPLLLVTATCACASPGCCNKGDLGRKLLTFKHLQLWGDIGSSLSSSAPTRASIPCSPRGPWWPPCSKGAWGRSRVAPSQTTATTSA